MASFEIELALIDYPVKKITALYHTAPSGFLVEDRSDKGWGIVFRQEITDNKKDLDAAFVSFLEALSDIETEIKSHNAILRIAIYTDSFDYTIRLKSFEILTRYGVQLEASIYPTDEDE